jgi:uncharacterized protein (DUF1499 family)
MTDNTETGNLGKGARVARLVARTGLALGVICAIASVAAGLGARMDLWHFRTGFMILRWATYGAFAVIVISIVAVTLGQRAKVRAARTAGVLGLVIGLLTAGPPLYQFYLANNVPPIHDISTDTANPPQFVAVVALRKKDDNSLATDPDTIAKQTSAYPDIKTMEVNAPPPQVMRRAEAAARAMGWEIVAVDPQALRIEATATTLLFGFTDDIVVRVVADAAGSRVDVRSASRVGRSDIGVNARRIRAYLKKLGDTA